MRKITYLIATLVLSGSVQFANAQEPTVAAPTPTYPESDVISFYGKTYEPAADNKLILRTNWGLKEENFVDDYINKDAVLHMINLEWSSFYTNAGANVTDYDYLHFDFWPDQDCQFVVGVTWNYPSMSDAYSEIFNLKANQWNSIDLPIENFDWTPDNKNYMINGLRLGSRDGEYESLSKQYAPNIYVSNIFVYKGTPSPTGINSAKADDSPDPLPHCHNRLYYYQFRRGHSVGQPVWYQWSAGRYLQHGRRESDQSIGSTTGFIHCFCEAN